VAKKQVNTETVKLWEKLSPQLAKAMKGEKIWLDHDSEVDCLYISFEKPENATDSEMLDNGIIVSYRGRRDSRLDGAGCAAAGRCG